MSADALTAIGTGLSALSSWLNDPNAKQRKYFASKLPGYASGLERGITADDIKGIESNLTASVMPQINQMASGYSARLGQSGYAKGAAISQFGKSLAPLLANLSQWRLGTNQANLRELYSSAATGSMAR
jgi:hypothetical protein